MPVIDTTQLTIVSLLATGISVVWVYFTKKESTRDKQEKEDSRARETLLNLKIDKKDELTMALARDSVKALTEIKGSVDTGNAAMANMSAMMQKVLDELVSAKLSNNRH